MFSGVSEAVRAVLPSAVEGAHVAAPQRRHRGPSQSRDPEGTACRGAGVKLLGYRVGVGGEGELKG